MTTTNPADAGSSAQPKADGYAVNRRVCEIMLKLLDGVERDIADGTLPSPHLAAYEALCRAEYDRRDY